MPILSLLTTTRSRLLSSTAFIRYYAAGGYNPELVADFVRGTYSAFGKNTATELLDHTRNGNATMTDSSGNIVWAPHNLLTYSEDFSASSFWINTDTTVVANAVAAPDGTQTADRLIEGSATSEHKRRRSFTTVVGEYTQAVFAKAGEREYLVFREDLDGVFVNTFFNLSTGSVVSTGAGRSSSIEDYGNGWFLCSVSSPTTAASKSLGFGISNDGINASYTGDGTSGIYVWGAHLYRSDLGGMADVPASERVLPTATKYVRTAGRVIGPELVTNGTFDTDLTGWTVGGLDGASITWNSGQADIVGNSYLSQQITGLTAGSVYRITASVTETNSQGSIRIGTTENSGDLYDSPTFNSSVDYELFIVPAGSGFWVTIKNEASVGVTSDYSFWDNISVKEVDVDPGAARYLPRVNHHAYNGSQWVNKGLLHESEARTNLVPYSIPDTHWSPIRASISQNVSGVLAPDGNQTVSKGVESTDTGSHRIDFVVTLTDAATYTYSIFAKAAERSMIALEIGQGSITSNYARFDLSSGIVAAEVGSASSSIEDFGNGWYRCSVTAPAGSTDRILLGIWDGPTQSYTGDGTSGVYIYGAQLEAGSTPSSYIPTNGASVTRPAETITIPAANLPWPSPVYVTGEELVTNGTFDTDTSGWTSHNSATLAWSSGTMTVDSNGSLTGNAYQTVNTSVGAVYEVTANVTPHAATGAALAASTTAGDVGNLVEEVVIGGSGETLVTLRFVASTTTTYIRAARKTAASGFPITFDNISVKEINPLALSIQMKGEMTYADEGAYNQIYFARWRADANNYISLSVNTYLSQTGQPRAFQAASGVVDIVDGGTTYYSPDINVPFNIASRHGSTFVNGAVDGVALTADTTPVALPDLENTDLELAYDFMGTISLFRIWANDLGDTGIEEASEPSTQATLFLSFDGSNNSYIDFEWSE